jgi:hypothetical protein
MRRTVEKKVKVSEVVCDAEGCGKASVEHSCWMCDADLCHACAKSDGDYHYCPRCWKTGEPFRERIAAEEQARDETIDAIFEGWSEACKK